MGLAGRRAGAEAVRVRRRSLFGRPAPRDRHRLSDGLGRPVRRERDRLLRGANATPGALPDRSDCGRLVGDARPPRLDRRARRDGGRRGGRRRRDRPERRARGARVVRPPGHPPHGGPERLRRPLDASASTTRAGGAASGSAACPAACAGAGCSDPCRGASCLSRAPHTARRSSRVESRSRSIRNCPATRQDADAHAHAEDAPAAGKRQALFTTAIRCARIARARLSLPGSRPWAESARIAGDGRHGCRASSRRCGGG